MVASSLVVKKRGCIPLCCVSLTLFIVPFPPPFLPTPSPPLPHGFGTEHAERPSSVALLPFSPVEQSVKLSTRL